MGLYRINAIAYNFGIMYIRGENHYKDLQSRKLLREDIECDYGGYDEYNYDLAQIGHNPYELISYLTALYMDFTFDDVKQPLDDLFEQQYSINAYISDGKQGRTTRATTRNIKYSMLRL